MDIVDFLQAHSAWISLIVLNEGTFDTKLV